MSTWPIWLFRSAEAAALTIVAALIGLCAALIIPAAASVAVPAWAWAWLTATPAAALAALWADLPIWLTHWLNWRAEQIARIHHRWGLPTQPDNNHRASTNQPTKTPPGTGHPRPAGQGDPRP